MTTNTTLDTGKAEEQKANLRTRPLPTAARILMGLIFFAAGFLGLLLLSGKLPPPPDTMPPGATAFNEALAKTGYMIALVSGTEFIVGAMLLLNRFVPLTLALIAPVIVNIIAFHAFLAPSGIAPGIVAAVLEIYLAWAYRSAYHPMLTARRGPDTTGRI